MLLLSYKLLEPNNKRRYCFVSGGWGYGIRGGDRELEDDGQRVAPHASDPLGAVRAPP